MKFVEVYYFNVDVFLRIEVVVIFDLVWMNSMNIIFGGGLRIFL